MCVNVQYEHVLNVCQCAIWMCVSVQYECVECVSILQYEYVCWMCVNVQYEHVLNMCQCVIWLCGKVQYERVCWKRVNVQYLSIQNHIFDPQTVEKVTRPNTNCPYLADHSHNKQLASKVMRLIEIISQQALWILSSRSPVKSCFSDWNRLSASVLCLVSTTSSSLYHLYHKSNHTLLCSFEKFDQVFLLWKFLIWFYS